MTASVLQQCLMSQEHLSEEPTPSAESKNFRLQGTTFLLTWPRNTTPMETCLERLKTLPNFQWAVVSTEKHQDGYPHLHAVVRLTKRLMTRKSNYFDFPCQAHGNYQSSRSAQASVQYVVKYGQYVSSGLCVEDFTNPKQKTSTSIAMKISTGASLDKINEVDPGFYLMNKRKVDEYYSWMENKRSCQRVPWIPFTLETISRSCSSTCQIMEWCNLNLNKDRPYGAKDIYIYGKTQLGKTSLLLYLEKFFRIYWLGSEDFYCLYNDTDFDIVVLDEFRATKTIQFLNSFCQAAPFPLKRKGLPTFVKKKHLPTILVSNYSLEECYHEALSKNPQVLDPLYRRLDIVYCQEPINIE